MKISTLNDYAQRIDRAVELLNFSINDETVPSLQDLADAAALSRYHFHRIFRLMTGETVNETVRRIRLARGAAAAENSTVARAAGEAVYSTSQSFARAMRAYTGMSTSEAIKSADLNKLFAARTNHSPLAIEIVELQPLELIAMRNRGDYADLDEVFGRLFEIAGGPETVEAIFGFYLSDPRYDAPEDCQFLAGLQVTDQPERLSDAHLLKLDSGSYLSLRHLGDYDDIPLALDELTLVAIKDELQLRDAPPLVHYLDDPEETAFEALRSDVHLPIESR